MDSRSEFQNLITSRRAFEVTSPLATARGWTYNDTRSRTFAYMLGELERKVTPLVKECASPKDLIWATAPM